MKKIIYFLISFGPILWIIIYSIEKRWDMVLKFLPIVPFIILWDIYIFKSSDKNDHDED